MAIHLICLSAVAFSHKDLDIRETSANNINGQLSFACSAVGIPSIQFRGWETASGRNANGQTQLIVDEKEMDMVEVTARLEIADFATCQQDGGYFCTFNSGDPSNIARSSIIDCPECE